MYTNIWIAAVIFNVTAYDKSVRVIVLDS